MKNVIVWQDGSRRLGVGSSEMTATDDIGDVAQTVFKAAQEGKAITIYAILSHRDKEGINKILSTETAEDGHKCTPFIMAARRGHAKVVSLLLEHFNVPIEQVGTVKFDGYVIEGATALWCAAGAGHFEVVKTLLKFEANVNHGTYTNSTPLRAACFDGRLDIVKYLIKHDADIHIPNKYNNTCLMIACYKGHLDVVTYLLENEACLLTRAHCGATALHFAAERGHLDIVKKLVEYKCALLKNDQGLTPLHIASESSRADIVEFFISRPECPKIDRVEALELLGASFANDKDNYDLEKAYHYLWLAMYERFMEPDHQLPKTIQPPVEAYNNHVECASLRQLEALKDDADALHMEALVVRERILGEDNVEIPHPVIFRGAVFADVAQFDRCTALWLRALNLRQRNGRTITKDLLRFAQVFSQMLHVGVEVDFDLVHHVFSKALQELEHDESVISSVRNVEEQNNLVEIHEANIHTALYILVIFTKLKCDKTQEFQLCKSVYCFNKLGLHIRTTGYTPLHMVVDENSYVDDFHVNDIVQFPHAPVAKLLIQCGASVNVIDSYGESPLHIIVRFSRPITNFLSLHNIILLLLQAGAHPDMANAGGRTPLDVSVTGVAEIILRTQVKFSLKCICARAVKKMDVPYQGQIPITLEEFVDMH